MASRWFSLGALFAYAFLAAQWGCGSASAPPAGSPDGSGQAAASSSAATEVGGASGSRLTVAAIPKSTGGDFWETVEKGARRAGAELDVDVRWEGTLTETEIAEQNKIIENMMNLGVDGIALAPLNNRAQRKTAQTAVDAGIPLVVFDSDLDGEAHVSFVATDNEAGGRLAAERMAEKLGGKGKVLVLRFVQGTASTEKRAEGFIAAAKAAGLEIVGDPYSEDGEVAGCKKTASNAFEGLIENNVLQLDGVFACNLWSALGMHSALSDLRKAGVEAKPVAIGFDSSSKLVEALHAGELDSLVVQNPERMGYLAVETLVKHLRREPIEKRIDTGVELATSERLKNEPALRAIVGE